MEKTYAGGLRRRARRERKKHEFSKCQVSESCQNIEFSYYRPADFCGNMRPSQPRINPDHMSFTPIKISQKTVAQTQAALDAVNGAATAHTLYRAEDIVEISVIAENETVSLVGAKLHAIGASYQFFSGKELPRAHDWKRKITSVRLERRATGWFLVEVLELKIGHWCQRPVLTLTPVQDERAVNRVRATYRVSDVIKAVA